MRQPSDTEQAPTRSIGLVLLRYGIGGVMVLAEIVMLVVDPSGLGVDEFAMAVGHPDARRRGGSPWTRR